MVNHEQLLVFIKGYITHGVAVFLIVSMVTLLLISAFKEINVPSILISLGSGAVGYYLRGINDNKQ